MSDLLHGSWLPVAGVFIIAYGAGSVSTAVITCKLMQLPDPRTTGSGNPGATNVLRSGSKIAAALTLLGDTLKGLLPVLIFHLASDEIVYTIAAALGALVGHLYPVFFRFKGGKGVATALGILFGTSWVLGLLAFATWLAISLSTRLSSLSAILTFAVTPAYLWIMGEPLELIYLQIFIAALIVWRHRSNVRNILTGSEPRIGGIKK